MNLLNKITLIAILSYLYLFFCLNNSYYDIIFIYFILLFFGYLIIKKNIFIIAGILLIIHFIFINLTREGNKNNDKEFDKAVERSDKRVREKEKNNEFPEPPLDEDEEKEMEKIHENKQDDLNDTLNTDNPLFK